MAARTCITQPIRELVGPHRIKTRFLYTEVAFLSLALNKNITLHSILISILFELCVRYKCFGNTKMNNPIRPVARIIRMECLMCMYACMSMEDYRGV